MADYRSSLPVMTFSGVELQVRTKPGSAIFIEGGNVNAVLVSAEDLDIRGINEAQDSILVYGWDGAANRKVAVNANGRLQVDVVSGGAGHEYQAGAAQAGVYGIVLLGGDGTNLQIVKVDADGELQVDIAGELPAGTNLIGRITISDGVEDAGVDVNNNLQVNLRAIGVTAVPISRDSNANSATNPIYVKTVEEEIGGEVHDFNQGVAVAKDGVDNHDYSVSSGKVLLLKKVVISASGAMKAEIQVGPSSSLSTKAVIFTSAAKLKEEVEFNPPIEIAEAGGGEMVRVVRTNRDNQAQDLYSTIMGVEV